MSYEQMWERLIAHLASLGSGSPRTTQLVMEREELDDWASTVNGSFGLTANEIRAQLQATPDDCPFLVFDTYELVPSQTETLPLDPNETPLDEYVRQHPDARLGWFANNRDGTRDYFADHPNEEG